LNNLHTLLLSPLCCACRNDLAHHCLDEHSFEDTDAYFYRFVSHEPPDYTPPFFQCIFVTFEQVSHEPPDYLLQRCTPASLSSTLRPVDGAAVHEVPVLLHCRVRFACHSPALSQCFCLRKAAVDVIVNSAISPPQTPGASPIPSVPASNSEYSDASVANSLAAFARWDQRHPGSCCGDVQRLFVVLWRLRDRWTFISFAHSCSTSYLSSPSLPLNNKLSTGLPCCFSSNLGAKGSLAHLDVLRFI
jgi:hypothetical protein